MGVGMPRLFDDPCECGYDYALDRDVIKYGFCNDGSEELDLFTIVNNPPENMFSGAANKQDKSDKSDKYVFSVAQLLGTVDSKMLLEKSAHV